MKQLQLEHLAPYLPYGVALEIKDEYYPDARFYLRNNPTALFPDHVINAKLVLSPLSQITQAIHHKGDWFIPMQILMEIWDELLYDDSSYQEEWYDIANKIRRLNVWQNHVLTTKLAEWHFDYLGMYSNGEGLIEKGLAIEFKE